MLQMSFWHRWHETHMQCTPGKQPKQINVHFTPNCGNGNECLVSINLLLLQTKSLQDWRQVNIVSQQKPDNRYILHIEEQEGSFTSTTSFISVLNKPNEVIISFKSNSNSKYFFFLQTPRLLANKSRKWVVLQRYKLFETQASPSDYLWLNLSLVNFDCLISSSNSQSLWLERLLLPSLLYLSMSVSTQYIHLSIPLCQLVVVQCGHTLLRVSVFVLLSPGLLQICDWVCGPG